jgi:hypothetical protein
MAARRARFDLGDRLTSWVLTHLVTIPPSTDVSPHLQVQQHQLNQPGPCHEMPQAALTTPTKVPELLREMWIDLDDKKKEAYRRLDNLFQNMKFILGVAGSGKSNLLLFIILMAKFGDKDQEFPVKAVYFVNHNSAVNDFATTLNGLCAKMQNLHERHRRRTRS